MTRAARVAVGCVSASLFLERPCYGQAAADRAGTAAAGKPAVSLVEPATPLLPKQFGAWQQSTVESGGRDPSVPNDAEPMTRVEGGAHGGRRDPGGRGALCADRLERHGSC